LRNAVIFPCVKQLQGTATREVAASAAQCVALFAAVERYPDWYPEVVRRVEVTERETDGRATKARAALHVVYGPLVRDFDFLLAISVDPPAAVRLERVRSGPADEQAFRVTWRAAEGPRTRIDVRLDANLPVPRFLPVGGIGDGIAGGFVDAAARELDKSG
jgi:Polyketide cyclase / dehydrase and lipid transport